MCIIWADKWQNPYKSRLREAEKDEAVMEKFAEIADLGVIGVPRYLQLEVFREEMKDFFWEFEAAITSVNFKNPSRILAPSDRFHVRAFEQIVPGFTTVEERMVFCRRQVGNVFIGAQGIPVVFQKRELLPKDPEKKGRWYASFDEKDRLWRDRRGCYSVPNLVVLSESELYDFDLRCVESRRDKGYAFFCFQDISALSE